MSEQERLLPLHSVSLLSEILNQHALWDRKEEFIQAAWNLAGRLYRGLYPKHEAEELTEKDMIILNDLDRLIYIAYTDGIGYNIQTEAELYQSSGIMIALTELNSLLSLIKKVYK